ncbi:MAG TPA: hypothetical protein VM286_04375 [Candidatus Thermoplasmatota archaeon]|nr:hypothetical protein [Candidatus Thermoplasmatota archaeon]
MPSVYLSSYDCTLCEAGDCTQCGWEQDAGEVAWELVDDSGEAWEAGFCQKSCARAWAKAHDLKVIE